MRVLGPELEGSVHVVGLLGQTIGDHCRLLSRENLRAEERKEQWSWPPATVLVVTDRPFQASLSQLPPAAGLDLLWKDLLQPLSSRGIGWIVSVVMAVPAQAFLETSLFPPWFPQPTAVSSPT